MNCAHGPDRSDCKLGIHVVSEDCSYSPGCVVAACKKCPGGFECAGFDCDSSGNSSIHCQPVPLKGYYASSAEPYKAYKCKSADECPGGRFDCADHRVGLLCSQCDTGRYLDRQQKDCEACGGGSNVWIFVLILPVVLLFDGCFIWLSRGEAQLQATFKLAFVDSVQTWISVCQTFCVLGALSITWPESV